MKTELRNITRPRSRAILCPANGIGVMARGCLLDLVKVGGADLAREARAVAKVKDQPRKPGTCFVTGPHDLSDRGVKRIYHAVITEYPGGVSSIDYVIHAVRSALETAIKDGMDSIAIASLETGDTKLDKTQIAGIVVQIAKEFDHKIKIRCVDKDKEFILAVRRLAGKNEHS